MKKEFYKITYQDIDIALDFFDGNELHFSEFLLATTKYYRGQIHTFKYKIVEKYFRTYKKTMDFIIEAKKTGKIGGIKASENQSDSIDTLIGSNEGTITPLIDTLIPNNKLLNSNNKEEIKKIDFSVFWNLYGKKKDTKKCIEKWEKLKPIERKQIIDCLPKYIKDTPDIKFRKNPLTFLNQNTWIDYLDTEIIIDRPDKWELRSKVIDGLYTAEYAKEKYNYDIETNKFLD
jgi:hypothetical protein